LAGEDLHSVFQNDQVSGLFQGLVEANKDNAVACMHVYAVHITLKGLECTQGTSGKKMGATGMRSPGCGSIRGGKQMRDEDSSGRVSRNDPSLNSQWSNDIHNSKVTPQ
jgi:hypothetical protein